MTDYLRLAAEKLKPKPSREAETNTGNLSHMMGNTRNRDYMHKHSRKLGVPGRADS